MASKGEDLRRSNTLSLVEAYKQQALLQASSRTRSLNEPPPQQQQRQASTLGRTSFKRNNNKSSGGGRCHDLVNMFERIASVSSIDTNNNGNHRNKNVLARTRSPRDLRKTRRQLLRDSNEDSSCEGVAFTVGTGEEHEEEAGEEEASGDEKTSGLFPLHQLLPQEEAFPSPPPSHRPQQEQAQGDEAEQMEETTEQKTEETSADEENNAEGKSLKREQKKKEEAMLAHVFQNRREQWLTKKDSLWNLLYTSTGSVCKRPQPPPGAASPLLKGATAELLRRRAAMDKKMQQQGHVRRPSNPLTGIVSASGEYEVEEDEDEEVEEDDTAEEPVEGKEREVKEEPAVAKGTEGRDKAATETEEDGLRRRKGSMSKRPSSLPPLANAASILGSSASQLSVERYPPQRRTLTGSLLIEEEVKEPIVVEEKRDVNGESKLEAATTLKKKGNLHIEYNYKEIDERYLEIDEDHPIARGAFGIVYKGLWQKTECAVKQLTMPLNNDKALHEFRLEASLMEKLGRHPNVVTFYGALTTGSKMCLVIEYARLGSMYDFLVNRRTQRNDISWLAVVKLLKDAAMGIAFLHRERIIHRDIAARNILVQGPHLTALVSDFGLSRMKSELYSYAITSNTVGAVKWMAPESVDRLEYSEKSDSWSFGVLIWEVVCRDKPWRNKTMLNIMLSLLKGKHLKIPRNCPCVLADLMERCFSYHPNNRPDFEEITDILASYYNTLFEDSELMEEEQAQVQRLVAARERRRKNGVKGGDDEDEEEDQNAADVVRWKPPSEEEEKAEIKNKSRSRSQRGRSQANKQANREKEEKEIDSNEEEGSSGALLILDEGSSSPDYKKSLRWINAEAERVREEEREKSNSDVVVNVKEGAEFYVMIKE